jgi:hypothetical protein
MQTITSPCSAAGYRGREVPRTQQSLVAVSRARNQARLLLHHQEVVIPALPAGYR